MTELEKEVLDEIVNIDAEMKALEDRKKNFMDNDPKCIDLKERMKTALDEFYILPGTQKGKINTQYHLFNFLITQDGLHELLMRAGKKIKDRFPGRKPHIVFSTHGYENVSILVPYEDEEDKKAIQPFFDGIFHGEIGNYNLVVRVEPFERIKRY